jgi:hypothetical protein
VDVGLDTTVLQLKERAAVRKQSVAMCDGRGFCSPTLIVVLCWLHRLLAASTVVVQASFGDPAITYDSLRLIFRGESLQDRATVRSIGLPNETSTCRLCSTYWNIVAVHGLSTSDDCW